MIVTSEPEGGAARRRLPLLFLTVFIDLVGFAIVLPLLPLYASEFGASGLVVGLLVTTWSAAQFVMAPVWGRLSDRYGRRPILLVGLLGSAAAYLVFAFADSVAWLLAAQLIGGLGGATVVVSEAYISDVTPPARRAGAMGMIGAAFGLGFTVGPALGGVMSTVSTAAPGLLAAGLCLMNAVIAFVLLPESHDPAEAAERRFRPLPERFAGLRTARASGRLRRVLLIYFLVTVAFAVIQPTLSLLGAERFGLGRARVGYLFAFLGLMTAIVQGGLVRRVVPRVGEARLIRWSAFPFVIGLALVAFAGSVPLLLVGLGLLALGYGGAFPSVISLVSRVAPAELRGGVLGVGHSVGSLARIVGPAMAGAAWDVRTALPYLLGAGAAAAGGLAAVGLPEAGPDTDAPDRPAS